MSWFSELHTKATLSFCSHSAGWNRSPAYPWFQKAEKCNPLPQKLATRQTFYAVGCMVSVPATPLSHLMRKQTQTNINQRVFQ